MTPPCYLASRYGVAAERTSLVVVEVTASGQPAVHWQLLYPAPVSAAALTVEQPAAVGQEFVFSGPQFVFLGFLSAAFVPPLVYFSRELYLADLKVVLQNGLY